MRALLLTFALVLLPLPAFAGATALTALNVRAGPGTAYHVVDVLRPGEAVAVADCRPGWCFIQSRHGAGWASAGYLAGLVDHDRVIAVHPAEHIVIERVVIVRQHHRVARWPEPWSEPTYPPRRLPSPWPHAVEWPERFW
jgi:uncharacterized protein YraI